MWGAPIHVEEALYGAGVDLGLELIRETESTVERAVFVGHEPTWSSLVQVITGGSVRMATATAAGIDLGAWRECGSMAGQIAFVAPPRLFPQAAPSS